MRYHHLSIVCSSGTKIEVLDKFLVIEYALKGREQSGNVVKAKENLPLRVETDLKSSRAIDSTHIDSMHID